MFILDSLLIGSIQFVLDKVVAAAEAEANDDTGLREQLIEAQLRLELGELDEAGFVEIERDVLARLRELRGDRQAGFSLVADDVRVAGIEATVADELMHEDR